ncbi:hypothetical protein [Patulibacter sp. SYSU D01012]|uniref:hypothetical protein n=1 Tax=Patulibacter sp. SYSU D01012 TaxID=2817381 RepID=UPI001B30485B|nr:hypothetical protein [Patulibacter sp. SYSU D01012]
MARRAPDPADAPKQRSRLFWVCVLVLVEVMVWTVLSVVGVSETIATVVALAVGVVLVLSLRDRIWGDDWRDRIAAERQRNQRR